MFGALTFVLCIRRAKNFPQRAEVSEGTASIQSTPQAKPEPRKWDLRSSQLITMPIEVSPTFYTSKSQWGPAAWAIWRSKGLWEALHKCLWKRHSRSLQVGHSDTKEGYQRATGIKWPFLVCDVPYQTNGLNLQLLLFWDSTEYSSKPHCEPIKHRLSG